VLEAANPPARPVTGFLPAILCCWARRRKGSGLGMDFFGGLQGSTIVCIDVPRWRYMCAAADAALASANSYPRPSDLPGKNLVRLQNEYHRGTWYNSSLHYVSFGERTSAKAGARRGLGSVGLAGAAARRKVLPCTWACFGPAGRMPQRAPAPPPGGQPCRPRHRPDERRATLAHMHERVGRRRRSLPLCSAPRDVGQQRERRVAARLRHGPAELDKDLPDVHISRMRERQEPGSVPGARARARVCVRACARACVCVCACKRGSITTQD
jgi:hypothetical protein